MTDQVTEQPSGDSGSLPLESRIANIFGPEPKQKPQPQRQEAQPEETQEVEASAEEHEAPASTEVPEETFDFEYEGEKWALPKKLEKAVLQEKDYTQKAQALAEQRRQVELKEQQARMRDLEREFHGNVAEEIRQIQMIEEVLKQPVNWQSMSTDEAFRHKIQLDELDKQRNTLKQTINQKYDAYQQQSAQHMQELQAKALETVKQKVPNWNPDLAKQIREHALSEGYLEHELNTILDPRLAVTHWKAMQFDQLQAKAKSVVPQVKSVKTTSARPMPQQVKDQLNFRKAISKTQPGSPQHQALVKGRIASIFSR